MANDLSLPNNIQVPAHLANRSTNALNTALAGGISSGVSVPRISLKAARFRTIHEGVETVLPTTSIEVVIVGANPALTKTFYAKEYNPDDEAKGPDCYSALGVRPEPDSPSKQNDLCASCRWNVFGSKITPQGKKVKACSDSKRLAVVPADDTAGTVYQLTVTASVLQDLNKYQAGLAQRGIAVDTVRTRLSFDPNASYPKLQFAFGGFNSEQAQTAADARIGSAEVKLVTGEDRGSDMPAPVSEPKVTAAPIKQVEPAPTGFGGAPAVNTGFGAPQAAPAPARAPANVQTVGGSVEGLTGQISDMIKNMGSDD